MIEFFHGFWIMGFFNEVFDLVTALGIGPITSSFILNMQNNLKTWKYPIFIWW
jgi:hypothetical protein